jgi:hypothetical protein
MTGCLPLRAQIPWCRYYSRSAAYPTQRRY